MTVFRRIKCLLGFHDIEVIGYPTEWSMHFRCPHCRREFGYNNDVRAVLPWARVAAFYRETRGYPTPETKGE